MAKGCTTDTYKVEANWTPVHDIRFRAGFNRAVRAPNIIELFTPQSVSLDGVTDPCAGNVDPNSTQGKACLKYDPYLKNNPGKLGNINANGANQYNGLQGGNPHLAPEKADTYTIGTVLNPRFLPGFSLTVDYYDIKVHGVIGGIGADNILNDCYSSGQYCDLIHRANNGSLWVNNSGYVVDLNQNVGLLATHGIDIQANYRMGLEKLGLEHLGHLDFNLVGTDSMEYHFSGSAISDCVGKFGASCGLPKPEWRHKMRVTWTTPWKWDISGQWRYLGGVNYEKPNKGWIDSSIPAYNYFDLTADWRVRDNVTLRAGVNNLFDKDPPIIPGDLSTSVNNGNTAPGMYDALGRYIFMGLTANF